jgi:hypothetical protein
MPQIRGIHTRGGQASTFAHLVLKNEDLLTGTAQYAPDLEENNIMKSLQLIKKQRFTMIFILFIVCV